MKAGDVTVALLAVTTVTVMATPSSRRGGQQEDLRPNSTNEPQFDPEEMEEAERQFYLGLIKLKIINALERAGLRPAQAPPTGDIPAPLLDSLEPEPQRVTTEAPQAETNRVILTQSVSLCRTSKNQTALCVSFRADMHTHNFDDLTSCDLWLNRTHWGRHRLKVTPVDIRPHSEKARRTGQSRRVFSATGWVSIGVRDVLQNALGSARAADVHLQFLCSSCDEDHVHEVYRHMAVHANQRPYLSLHERSPPTRTKRSLHASMNNRCQRKSLNVDFRRDLNMSYVIRPTYYNAYYCKGQCGLPGQKNHGSVYHFTLRSFLRSPAGAQLARTKRDCCVSTETDHITMLVTGDKGEVNSIRLEDMVTVACECRH